MCYQITSTARDNMQWRWNNTNKIFLNLYNFTNKAGKIKRAK